MFDCRWILAGPLLVEQDLSKLLNQDWYENFIRPTSQRILLLQCLEKTNGVKEATRIKKRFKFCLLPTFEASETWNDSYASNFPNASSLH